MDEYSEPCLSCGNAVTLDEPYEPEMCCGGAVDQCGCGGFPTNPVLCTPCEDRIFGKVMKEIICGTSN